MSKLRFVPFHTHTGGSLYDGFGAPVKSIRRAKSLGMTHLAITDHGTMCMNEQHTSECHKAGIIPINGVEAYFMREFKAGKEFLPERRHLTLVAKNLSGYANLCKIMTSANLNNFYMKPIADFDILERFNEGVVCFSGCVLGEIPQMIIQNKWDEALRMTDKFLEIYGDNFYFEVQPQDFDDQKKANEGLIKLSQKYKRPAVMTNDSHYSDPGDLDTYLLFRQMGRNVDDIQIGNIRKQYQYLYISDGDEMNARWKSLMGTDGSKYVEASQQIADTFESYQLVFEEKVPEFIGYNKKGERISAEKALAIKAKKGLEAMGLWKEPYIARAMEEMRVISIKKGKADYYLMVGDMIEFANRNDVVVGPGRGSGVASLIAYALGITKIDPIYFDLMFERFMTEERKTIPDFDIDFSAKKYGLVVEYLMQKYQGQVAQIANVLYYKGDNLLNDLAKALNVPDDDLDYLKKVMGVMGFKENEPILSKIIYNKRAKAINDKYGIISHFCKIWGNPKAFGQHASGVAITPGAIDDYVPLFVRGKEGDRKINTQYDMDSLIHMNVVKIDVLRVDAIDTVKECCDILGIKPTDIPLDDQKTFESYRNLNVKGIFQFDSYGGIEILRRVQPTSIFELSDATSLDRPGALQMDQVDVYERGKAGDLDTKSLLYPYCQRTHGALLYQEQIMQACRGLAGMSWGDASKVMKNLVALPADHPLTIQFVEGAKKVSGIDKNTAIELFHNLTSYTFNAGHSVAYAVLSYWMMWLKVNHKEIFFLHSLRNNIMKKSIKDLEADSVLNRLPIFLPHVNGEVNYHIYDVFGEKAIRSGLLTIPNVGGVAARDIEIENKKNGPFESRQDFTKRMMTKAKGKRTTVTSRVLTALEGAGALEFDFNIVKQRTIEYNSTLLSRTIRSR
ncbi:MAG TPA: DNA polymerase III subunit alpha [Cyclobacteriaceae bacterium]|jgi:DNA polymerase-3 subunit alpha|nr:DNA polymerase III subunit alpha [Cyclobacteriaceae bacterium]